MAAEAADIQTTPEIPIMIKPLIYSFTWFTMASWLTAAPVITDDFEGGALGEGWDDTTGAAIVDGEGAQGSANYVAIEGMSGPMGVSFDPDFEGIGATDFLIDFYVRVQSTGSRQLTLMVSTEPTVSTAGAINLRHQNGWAVFSGGWQPLDLPAMDPDLWYRMRLTCNGWGSGGANYDIELSDADGSEFTSSVEGITFYQAGDPNTTTAGSFSFNTFWGGNPGYDIDSVSVETKEVVAPIDDPNISVQAINPFADIVHELNPAPVTAIVTVENAGATNALTITDATAITGDTPEKFSILTALPLTIAAGETADLEIQFDAAGDGGNFLANLVIASDDASNPTTEVPLRSFVPSPSGANVIGNGDFELNAENLALWDTLGAPATVAGFAPGSTTAALIDAKSDIKQPVAGASDWYVDFYFQVLETGARAFNLVLNAPGSEVNIRAQGTGEEVGFWNTFIVEDKWGEPLEGLPGLIPEERYFMRVVGRGWEDDSPSYDILLSEPGGVALVHRAEGLTRFRNSTPTAPLQQIKFSTEFGNGAGFQVDDVRFINGTPPPESPFSISDFNHNTATNESTISWSAFPGTYYDVETSLDLVAWQSAFTAVEANADASMDTLALVPGSTDAAQQFVRVVQVQAPPLLETGFEDGAEGWVVSLFPNGTETSTTWEFGEPTNGPGAAKTGANVAGTGLADDYDDGTTVLLNSPTIDPTGVAGRINLSFWHFLGVNDNEGGQVNVLEEDGTVIESFDPFFGGDDGNTPEWTQAVFQLPKLDPVRPFKIQFAFLTGDDGTPNNLPGWFIDDVRVGK